MKLLQFKRNNETRLGIKTNKGVLDVKEVASRLNVVVPTNLQSLILAGEEGTRSIHKLLDLANDANHYLNEKEIEYQPALSHPEKIVCVGLNYLSHAEESNMEIPASPVLFSKFNNALASHQQDIPLPTVAEKYDYEAELVIIIGKEAKDVSEEDALSYVFGYSVGNDLSARDLQLKSGQWLIGKTLDCFAPIGPYLMTANKVNPLNLTIECKVNGERRQLSNTENMIFNCPGLISYISQHMTLKPGDVIFTGTPEGVIMGYSEQNQVWLKSGDEVEVSIESIGTLKNTLV